MLLPELELGVAPLFAIAQGQTGHKENPVTKKTRSPAVFGGNLAIENSDPAVTSSSAIPTNIPQPKFTLLPNNSPDPPPPSTQFHSRSSSKQILQTRSSVLYSYFSLLW